MPQDAWAHSPEIANSQPGHDLVEHLHAVATRARMFAAPCGSDWAHLAGLWHDLGKFRPGFQSYVRQSTQAHIEGRAASGVRGRDKTHSAAGALHALGSFKAAFGAAGARTARALAYVIAGHHAGLDNWHDGLNPRLLGSGKGDSQREFEEALAVCGKTHKELLRLPADFQLRAACEAIPGVRELKTDPLALSLWVRMLFSAVVDADFLDTEAYFDRTRPARRGGFPALEEMSRVLDAHLDTLAERALATGIAGDPVMQARQAVLAQCRAKAALPPGVFSLTVPTGGGKTLASLVFALTHSQAHGLRRVIVAIPYTSIVEQTADVFIRLFGAEAVVEHHSQADAEEDQQDTARTRLACENWDAPLVVTTNVQLLESLFARRTSRCRKLHNLAGSVIVLDEAQWLPAPFLQPILDALRVLVKHYGVTLLLCTATQPVLTDSTRFDPRQALRGLPAPVPIVDDEAALYAALERVRFEWPADWQQTIEVPVLASRLMAEDCVLVIVNTRRDAADLVHALDALDAAAPATGGAIGKPERTLHLSAAMCGQHRADVINEIRQRLATRRDGSDLRPLRVVSTQLVEAGVDIDFPLVVRALAGLDSIAQAAGRCNREGLLGARGGRVWVVVRPIPKMLSALRAGARATVSALNEQRPQSLGPDDFRRYFKLYYDGFDLDERRIVDELRGNADFTFNFRTAAEKFRLIDDEDQASVVVPYVPQAAAPGSESPIAQHLRAIESGSANRWHLRSLQRYIVNVRLRDLNAAQVRGAVREVLPGLFVLEDPLRYDVRLGLLPQGALLDAASLVQ